MGDHIPIQITALQGDGEFKVGKQSKDRKSVSGGKGFGGKSDFITSCCHLRDDVTAIRAVPPVAEPASGDVVHSTVKIVSHNRLGVITVGLMAAEGGRSGIVEPAGGDHAGQPAGSRGLFEQGLERKAVRSDADMAVGGLLPGSQRSAAGCGIGDEIIGAGGEGQTGHWHGGHVQLAMIEDQRTADVLQTHSVANHKNDITSPGNVIGIGNGDDVICTGNGDDVIGVGRDIRRDRSRDKD